MPLPPLRPILLGLLALLMPAVPAALPQEAPPVPARSRDAAAPAPARATDAPLRLEIQLATDGAWTPPRVVAGLTTRPVTPALAKHLRIDADAALLVADVLADLPAERAGLEPYDVITRIDGSAPVTRERLRDALAARDPGDALPLTVRRGPDSVALVLHVADALGSEAARAVIHGDLELRVDATGSAAFADPPDTHAPPAGIVVARLREARDELDSQCARLIEALGTLSADEAPAALEERVAIVFAELGAVRGELESLPLGTAAVTRHELRWETGAFEAGGAPGEIWIPDAGATELEHLDEVHFVARRVAPADARVDALEARLQSLEARLVEKLDAIEAALREAAQARATSPE